MIDFPTGVLATIFLILTAAGLTQGILGFGFGIVAMTLLPIVMGFRDAITFMALMNAINMPLALYWQKRSFNWRNARFIIIGALIGIPLGSLMVGLLPDKVLFMLLGAAMTTIGASHFISRHKTDRPTSPRLELPVGLASGILAAGFNMGGPPTVAYVYSRSWKGEEAKAILASVFVVTSFARCFFIGITGDHLSQVLILIAIVVVPTGIILRSGIAIGRRIPHHFLRPVVFAYLGLTGLYYMFLH